MQNDGGGVRLVMSRAFLECGENVIGSIWRHEKGRRAQPAFTGCFVGWAERSEPTIDGNAPGWMVGTAHARLCPPYALFQNAQVPLRIMPSFNISASPKVGVTLPWTTV